MTNSNPDQSSSVERLNQWMFESSPDCVKLLDLEGRLIEMNWNGQCAMEIEDFDSLCGGPWQSFWPEESHVGIEASLDAARAGKVGRFSAFCPTAKGTPKWWDVTVTPVYGSDGQVEKILSVSRDMTALHIAKEEQRDIAARLQFMLRVAKVGEWELSLDNGNFRTSRLHDRCFGYDTPRDNWNLDAFLGHVHADDRERVRELFAASASEGEDCRLECRVVWQDRSVHWISVHGSIYRSNGGKPERRMVGTVVDITERKRSDALAEGQRTALELAVADADLASILEVLTRAAEEGSGDTVKASVLLLDEDGKRLRHGAAPSISRHFSEAVDGLVIGPSAGACGRAAFLRQEVIVSDIAKDPLCAGLRDMALASGLRSCWSHPILSSRGTLLGTLAIYRAEVWEPGYTERKPIELLLNTTALILDRHQEALERRKVEQALRQVADELKEANRQKTEFLATLAHELRNPLAPILSGLEVMKMAGDDPKTVSQVRKMMERQASQMAHLVDDLLDLARISSGKLEIRPERVVLQSVLDTAIEASLPHLEAKQHAFAVKMPEEPLHLDADPTRISQVISNLLNNAAKYTPEGGNVELVVEQMDAGITISVADNGAGLSPETISNVFEMFAQVEQNTKSSQGGLGIGLTLVRRLVDLHGGKVTASSSGIGKGSTFSVQLPLGGEPPGQASVSSAPAEDSSPTTGGLRVLVVDDNIDAAEMLSALLDISGHSVRSANGGRRATELIEEFRPHAVFLDLGLPDMDGYEVAREIRARPHLDKIILVALTGWGSEADRMRTQEAGFNHHLTKPASFEDIDALLAELSAQSMALELD